MAHSLLTVKTKHMRIAIPLWQGRISPVFDEARRILLLDVSEKQEQHRQEESLVAGSPFERAQLLPRLGVNLLICGMISQTQQAALTSAGIKVIPHICGHVEEVITAFLDNRIENEEFLMPGCRSRKKSRKRMLSAERLEKSQS
jgi:predicted Fe-Mo cluster-binding NifX family protein